MHQEQEYSFLQRRIIMYKIIGSILIVGGGIYVAYKTDLLKKTKEKFNKDGSGLKKSFMEGYHQIVNSET
jgi:hypothetical protein